MMIKYNPVPGKIMHIIYTAKIRLLLIEVTNRLIQSGFDIVTTSSWNVGRCSGLQRTNRT